MTQAQEEPKETEADKRPKQKTAQEWKAHVCNEIRTILMRPLMQERLMKMAGGDESRIAKNLTSFLAVISQDDGSGKPPKFYYQCSISSLVICFLESMNMQLPFDSRNLVCMIIYEYESGMEAELDISYQGFIFALNKHYKNAFVDAKLVFEDDEFICEESGGKATFIHKPKKSFRTVDKDFNGIAGGYCYFSYTLENGEPISRIVRMSRDDILKIRSKARTKAVWDEFSSEMGIKAVIRRGSKIPFAAIDLDMDITETANKHYVLDRPNALTRLEQLISAQDQVLKGKDTPEPEKAAKTEEKKAEADPEKKPEPETKQEVMPPAGDAGDAGEVKPEKEGTITDVVAEPSGTAAELPPEVQAAQTSWDGKTVYTGDGKHTAREFPSAQAAYVYVKKIISQRKHKSSRKDIVDGNAKLIAALVTEGDVSAADDLNKMIEQGI